MFQRQLKGSSEVIASLPGGLEYELEAGDLGEIPAQEAQGGGDQVEYLSVVHREGGGNEVFPSRPPAEA